MRSTLVNCVGGGGGGGAAASSSSSRNLGKTWKRTRVIEIGKKRSGIRRKSGNKL